MKQTVIILLILLSVPFLRAQNEVVIVKEDPRIATLIQSHIEHNKTAPYAGFRINIFSESGNSSRKKATEAAATFAEKFPNIACYMRFEAPNFKVNIGDFRTRLEAAQTLEFIQNSYPQAFIAKDFINVQALLGITLEPETDTLPLLEAYPIIEP
ncbi:hypothetical protein FACS1894201_00200 [Bacteroidia bacterium]|nr:hypothetical protein FACS1894201_00200 [Bacteroidia bacterium]